LLASVAIRVELFASKEARRTRARAARRQSLLVVTWAAKVAYFRIYDLRSTYATRLSAGGVADEWVTQLLRQGDAKVFKKYSQMKLQNEARSPREIEPGRQRRRRFATGRLMKGGFATVCDQGNECAVGKCTKIRDIRVGA